RALIFFPASVGAPPEAAASAARLASALVSSPGPDPESQPAVTTAATRRSLSTRSLIRLSFPQEDPAALAWKRGDCVFRSSPGGPWSRHSWLPPPSPGRVEGLPQAMRSQSLFQKAGLTVVGWVQPTNAKPWHAWRSVGCTHPTTSTSATSGTDSQYAS